VPVMERRLCIAVNAEVEFTSFTSRRIKGQKTDGLDHSIKWHTARIPLSAQKSVMPLADPAKNYNETVYM
jgi:hypothetical protein